MNSKASSDIEHKYQSLGRGSTVIQLIAKFDQKKFIDANRKYAESLSDKLNKALLEDHHTEKAAEGGFCSAAVMQWLDTGSIPPPSADMVTKLSKIQGSGEVDNERDFLTFCSNLSAFAKKLTKVKDSNGLDLNDTPTFIDYLLDNGNINTKYKLFLILMFKDGNSHSVGLNLGTKSFFDPNEGVWDIQTGKDPASNITYSIFGLEEIKKKYKNVVTVRAITYL